MRKNLAVLCSLLLWFSSACTSTDPAEEADPNEDGQKIDIRIDRNADQNADEKLEDKDDSKPDVKHVPKKAQRP